MFKVGRGGGGRGKKRGEILKEKKGRNGKEKKRKPWREGDLRVLISLKSPMPYPAPTVTLPLHCEQFWTFIVIVTFDLFA